MYSFSLFQTLKVMEKWIFALWLVVVMGCVNTNNNYNKMLDWMNSIEKGASIQQVKASQPDFVIVHWARPDTASRYMRFSIEPKNHHDILKMDNALVFNDKGFVQRSYHK